MGEDQSQNAFLRMAQSGERDPHNLSRDAISLRSRCFTTEPQKHAESIWARMGIHRNFGLSDPNRPHLPAAHSIHG
jgi:hypothetical protein